jgi:hypothetical protein
MTPPATAYDPVAPVSAKTRERGTIPYDNRPSRAALNTRQA